MLKKLLIMLAVIILVIPSALAERIQVGWTPCLLQPAREEADPMKRYVLFVGSGDYFRATYNFADYTAADGILLIPQGNSKYQKPSAASDYVIEDLKPYLLAWAEEGCDLTLIGYSSGGYPATALAIYLAEEGYTGTIYILDGMYGDYRGVSFNEEYYRTHLSTWDLRIYSSSDREADIAERTRNVGSGLMEDSFVTYHQYDLSHRKLQAFFDVIMNGAEAPEPLPPPETPAPDPA